MTQIRILPFLLLGLPLGLIILAAISFYFHLREPDKTSAGLDPSGARVEIQEERLKKYVTDFADVIGPRNAEHPSQLTTAINYIESTVGPRNIGYDVQRFSFRVGNQNFENVTFQQAGQSRRDEVVIVGAYYDSAGDSPGANWNATGMAALFSLAHYFIGTENERTLRFVAFANGAKEHRGSERDGSVQYAEIAGKGAERIVGLINLEGLGIYGDDLPEYPESVASHFPEDTKEIAIVSNLKSADLANEIMQRWPQEGNNLSLHLATIDPSQPYPDIFQGASASFWQQGYPAVTLSASGSFRVPDSWVDASESIDYERFTKAVQGISEVIRPTINP